MMKLEEKLMVALDWAKLNLTEKNFEGAVEMIEMDMEYMNIDSDEAIDQWIKNTKENHPGYFQDEEILAYYSLDDKREVFLIKDLKTKKYKVREKFEGEETACSIAFDELEIAEEEFSAIVESY